jgi:hypothetical protein
MSGAWLAAVEQMPLWAAALLLLCQFSAPWFHWWQNRDPARLGGPISRAKAAWLSFAANLWLALPLFLAASHIIYLWLAASMLLRTVIELPLCAKRRWSTNHGLTHDALHAVICLAFLPSAPPGVRFWLVLTLLSLAVEVVFVLKFRKSTAGPAHGVFFVPDGPQYARLNLLTDLVRMPMQYLMVSVLIAALCR